MRQKLKVEDERYLLMRSLSIDYAAGCNEVAHSHAWPQLLYLQSGAVRVEVDGDLLIVPPRRGLWIPANRPHRLSMIGPVTLRTLYARCGDWVPAEQEKVRVFDVVGLLHELILRICELQWLDERSSTDSRLQALVLDEISAAPLNELRLVMPVDSRAARLAKIFLADECTERELSAAYSAIGLSRRTAERIFRKETGLTPARWHRLARLSVGLACLSGGGSIAIAALQAGYTSRAAFSSAFSKTFGFSPSAIGHWDESQIGERG